MDLFPCGVVARSVRGRWGHLPSRAPSHKASLCEAVLKGVRAAPDDSQGSLAELGTLIIIAGRLGYFAAGEVAKLELQMDEVGRLLNGLANKLKQP